MNKRANLFLALMAFSVSLMAQTYVESAISLGVQHQYNGEDYGYGVSFVDFNNDGWDDISFGAYQSMPQIYINIGNGFAQSQVLLENEGEIKQITWVDFDNDGDQDVFLTRKSGPVSLHENLGNFEFQDITFVAGFPDTSELTFGNSWGDYNNDGFLDVYIANYNSDGVTNWLYKNNGDGTFTEVTEEAGVSNGSQYTFGALWIDYDHDGLQDLFVANDRMDASNYMYRNLGDGTFEDLSEQLGLNYNVFSMSYTGGDYDNDGDLDLYVSNNPFGHLLHKQTDIGLFEEVANGAGVATYDMGWAGIWMDYDLDGWQDLYIASSPFWEMSGIDKFYRNIDGNIFVSNVGAGIDDPGSWSYSAAVGDLNNDGMFDLCVVNEVPEFCHLYQSQQGSNNYLKVKPVGSLSNRDGVGTRFTLWAGGKMQTRYTYCGEGYLTQNSRWEIFGIGQSEIVDSLKVEWLSGQVDMYYDIAPNQCYTYVESSDLTFPIIADQPVEICAGDSVKIMSAATVANVLWSNGVTAAAQYVDEPGQYHYSGIVNGIPVNSDTILVSIIPELDPLWVTNNPSCFELETGIISLEESDFAEIDSIWINGEYQPESFPFLGLGAGNYEITLLDTNGCETVEAINLFDPDELEHSFEVENALCFGDSTGAISISISGGTPPYSLSPDSTQLQSLSAGIYNIEISDSNGCSNLFQAEIAQNEQISAFFETDDANSEELGSANFEIEGGVPPYFMSWTETGLPAELVNLSPGEYFVTISDSLGCQITSSFVIGYTSIQDEKLPEVWIEKLNQQQMTINSEVHGANVLVFDNLGRIITRQELKVGSTVIELNLLASGVYSILITTKTENLLTKRFSILRD